MINQVISLTDAAAARAKMLMSRSDKAVLGLRVGVNIRGCSGLSYVFKYAEERIPSVKAACHRTA